MIRGYIRVSTSAQNSRMQRDALVKEGVDTIYEDEGLSGVDTARQGLKYLLEQVEAGDTVVVWRLDRLGRSLADLINIINTFQAQGVHFKSLNDGIDTSSTTGKLVFHIMGALAEFERDLIKERTRVGMKAAKEAGVRLGRPPALSPSDFQQARDLLKLGHSRRRVAHTLGIGVSTLNKYMRAHFDKIEAERLADVDDFLSC